jgi:hypothetical protein
MQPLVLIGVVLLAAVLWVGVTMTTLTGLHPKQRPEPQESQTARGRPINKPQHTSSEMADRPETLYNQGPCSASTEALLLSGDCVRLIE